MNLLTEENNSGERTGGSNSQFDEMRIETTTVSGEEFQPFYDNSLAARLEAQEPMKACLKGDLQDLVARRQDNYSTCLDVKEWWPF